MKFAQRKRERRALIANLVEQDWDVFGTLRFVNGRTIGRNTADKLLRSYWNRVDRVFFGHAADRQNMRAQSLLKVTILCGGYFAESLGRNYCQNNTPQALSFGLDCGSFCATLSRVRSRRSVCLGVALA